MFVTLLNYSFCQRYRSLFVDSNLCLTWPIQHQIYFSLFFLQIEAQIVCRESIHSFLIN